MDVNAVADDFRSQRLALENRGREARLAVVERRHPIEKVRGMPGASVDPLQRLFVGGAGVPQRDRDSLCGQLADQIDGAVDLRCDGHDPDVVRRRVDFGQDLRAREVAIGLSVRWKAKALERLGPAVSGLMKLLSRCAGNTRAPPDASREARTAASIVLSAAGAQAIDVGQKAVTP